MAGNEGELRWGGPVAVDGVDVGLFWGKWVGAKGGGGVGGVRTRCRSLSKATIRESARTTCSSEFPPLPSTPNPSAEPMPYMADAARDNLDQGLARPGRLDGDLSHVKAVPVVVRHTCQHGGRQRVGGGSGRSHFVVGVSWRVVGSTACGRQGEAGAVVCVRWKGRRVSQRCNVPRPCAFVSRCSSRDSESRQRFGWAPGVGQEMARRQMRCLSKPFLCPVRQKVDGRCMIRTLSMFINDLPCWV